MRTTLTLLVTILLSSAMIVSVDAQPGQGQGPGNNGGESSGPDGNGTNGGPGNSEQAKQQACQAAFNSGDQNVSDPEHECYEFYAGRGSGASQPGEFHPADHRKEIAAQKQFAATQDNVPDHAKAGFTINETGYHGVFVSFVPDLSVAAVYDIKYGETTLFSAIETPGFVDQGSIKTPTYNKFELRGAEASWKLLVMDHNLATVRVQPAGADDAPFIIHFPNGTVLTPTPDGSFIQYPSGLVGRVHGQLEPIASPDSNETSETSFAAPKGMTFNFQEIARVGGEVVARLPDAGLTTSISQSVAEGRVGGELNVLRGNTPNTLASTSTLFEDMVIDFTTDDAAAAGAPGTVYELTVDSVAHEGKTIVVNIESGLVDPMGLQFRYFNVNENETVEATIRQASNLEDVLDALDDGVVAEYWVVEDIHGVHALISIPHFSIHKVQFQDIGNVIIEQPSLVLGVIGALLVVGLATRAMFRRPAD